MGIKIKDIAAAANLSVATVSLALNNKPGISDATREKVLHIARTLNEGAVDGKYSALRTGSIRFIKFVKHGHILNRDHDAFISLYIDGLEPEARNNGYNLEINTFNASEIKTIIKQVKESPIDGLIVLGTEMNHNDLKPFEQIKKPVVIIDTSYDFMKFDFVDMNNEEALFQIINYFIKHGHKEIGMVKSPVEAKNFELRYTGFTNALRYFGLPFKNEYVFSVDSTYDGAYNEMLQILSKGPTLPTALFSSNDIIAYGCIKALNEKGYDIPEDISIIGFDDIPMSSFMTPPLTTMRVSKRQIGKMAARLIITRINDDFSAPTMKVTIGGKLVIRESVKNLNS